MARQTANEGTSEIDVLVVGAGPTGLTMAAELARYGVALRLIDKASAPPSTSRALAIQARSLELLQKMGLAERFLAAGQVGVGASIYVEGEHKVDFDFDDIGVDDTPYARVFFLSQAETERYLSEYAASLDVELEREVELTSFAQDEDGVTAELKHHRDGRTERLRCRYIVGCDGAHSTVRHTLGLEFAGAPYEQDFILADVKIDWPFPHDRLIIFLGEVGLLAVFPLKESGLNRLIAMRPHRTGPERETEAELLDEMAEAVREYTKRDVRLFDPYWVARFHLHHRGVDQYRVRRAFVAGDAAHIHSPAGGQGMNTGIQDAYNLAWKLALVVHGRAGSTLLDTYQEERYPVGQFLLKGTDRLFRVAASDNRFLTSVRNTLFPPFVRLVLSRRAGRRRAFRFISQLAIHYPESSFRAPPEDADFELSHATKPGWRAPDAPLPGPGPATLFQAMADERFHALIFVEPGERARTDDLKPWSDLVTIHVIEDAPGSKRARAMYGVTTGAVYLVRPDGYIAQRSLGSSTKPLRAFLEHWIKPARPWPQRTSDTPDLARSLHAVSDAAKADRRKSGRGDEIHLDR